jgi:hypothetical protein
VLPAFLAFCVVGDEAELLEEDFLPSVTGVVVAESVS